ncbi:MAG: heme A synthase [Acidobacteriota bacterium]
MTRRSATLESLRVEGVDLLLFAPEICVKERSALNLRYHRGPHLFAIVTACATFILILAGGLVTSNDAGLSVPDWPLSFGKLMPEMVGGVFYEHGHRMIAASVGGLTLILAAWLWRREERRWVRNLGWVALAAVVAQGVLGGLTVLFLLPAPLSVLHACLAQTFFCLVVTLALVTSPSWMKSWRRESGFRNVSEPRIAVLTTAAIYFQLILGALVRHSGMVEGSKGAVLVPSTLIVHLMGALLVSGLVLVLALTVAKRSPEASVAGLTLLLVGLLMVQLLLGVGAYVVRATAASRPQPEFAPVLATTSHVGVGALLLAISLLVTLKLVRETRGIRGSGSISEARLAEESL